MRGLSRSGCSSSISVTMSSTVSWRLAMRVKSESERAGGDAECGQPGEEPQEADARGVHAEDADGDEKHQSGEKTCDGEGHRPFGQEGVPAVDRQRLALAPSGADAVVADDR
jgi:hypothetical protein